MSFLKNTYTQKYVTFALLLCVVGGVFFIPFSVEATGGAHLPPDAAMASAHNSSSLWDWLSPAAWLATIFNSFLWLFSWAVEMGGGLLDASITQTVIEMPEKIDNITVIGDAWALIRDITNMVFIFILLYIAITTILGIQGGQTYQLLAYTIVIGLLLNFSLFFTEVIIDASNIIAIQFYEGITVKDSIATQLLNDISLPTSYSTGIGQTSWTAIMVQGVGGIILFLIVAFVLFAAAILLILRFVILIFLMIISPLAFAAFILPSSRSYFWMWLKKLFSESFWVPIYFALLYIAMRLGAMFKSKYGGGTLAEVISDPTAMIGGGEVLVNFFIIIFFFGASLVIAKQIGATGASKATSLMHSTVGGAAGGITAGTLGFAGRHTAGRLGQRFSESGKLKEMESKGGISGKLAQGVRSASSRTAQSSFDVRATQAGKTLPLGKAAGAGGFKKASEEQAKKIEKRAEDLAPSDTEKADARNAVELARNKKQKDLKKVEEQQKRVDEQIQNDDGSRTNELQAQKDNLNIQSAQIEGSGQYDKDIADAQQKVDRLEGVDVKKVKERIKNDKELMARLQTDAQAINKMSEQDMSDLLNTNELTDQDKAKKGLIQHQGAAKERAEQYTRQIEQTGEYEPKTWLRGAAQRALSLSTRRQRLRAGAHIRKNVIRKQSTYDQMKKLVKENPELQPESDGGTPAGAPQQNQGGDQNNQTT